MKYSQRKINSNSKRHVHAKEFAAELFGVSRSSDAEHTYVNLMLTLCDSRGDVGEGFRMNISFDSSDANEPLMIAFIGRMLSMMSADGRAEIDRILLETP